MRLRSRPGAVFEMTQVQTGSLAAADVTRNNEGLCFTVQAGEVVSLSAPEGICWTLLRLAQGEIQPSSGKVSVLGRDLGSVGPRWLKRARRRLVLTLGVRPSWEGAFDNEACVLDHLVAAGSLAGELVEKAEVDARALLTETGLSFLQEAPLVALDTVEHVRLALLRSLLLQPRFLLIEPGMFADAFDTALWAAEILCKETKAKKFGVFWIDPSPRVTSLADRMYVYSRGVCVNVDTNVPDPDGLQDFDNLIDMAGDKELGTLYEFDSTEMLGITEEDFENRG